MQTPNELQNWIAGLDRRLYAVMVGLLIGITGGLVGLSVALLGPVIPFGLLIGLLAALYVLTSVNAALYGVIAVMALLPFGTFPVRIGFTPTLLDLAMGAFVAVYALQWATGRRPAFKATPVHLLILLYMAWLVLAFALGLRYGMPTSADLRQFAETLLSISMVFILVDLLGTPEALRRLVLKWSEERERWLATLKPNPRCRKLGPFPPDVVRVAREATDDLPFSTLAAGMLLGGLHRAIDVNVLGVVERYPKQPTVEVRCLPGSLDAEATLTRLSLVDQFLESVV